MTADGMARVVSATLSGLHGLRVRVEVDLAPSLPGFSLVGLPSASLRESRERIGAALRHSGFAWPDRRITVSLAPADVRKDGAAMDLAIAVGILLASGQVPRPRPRTLRRTLFVGELALDGALRPARGVFALGLDAARLGVDRFVLPTAQATALTRELDDVRCLSLRHLRELPRILLQLESPSPRSRPRPATADPVDPALHQIRGQGAAKRALMVAAAGGHHLMLSGPPGCGKSMLARRLPALLPPLDEAMRRARLRIYSCAGVELDPMVASRPPLRSPHHSVSRGGLIGGGRPPRPGEITLAHGGVLLLDEAAEFGADQLEMLREPLVAGEIQLARLGESLVFPSSFQLVATTNPCPCGFLGSEVTACRCRAHEVARYRRRLSGPLRDRIDLWVEMDRESAETILASSGADREDYLGIIRAAHERAKGRGTRNARLEGAELESACGLTVGLRGRFASWADRLAMSARAVTGTLRVARTIADLAQRDIVDRESLAEALSYRRPG